VFSFALERRDCFLKKLTLSERILILGLAFWFLSVFLPVYDTTGKNIIESYAYGFHLLLNGVLSIPILFADYKHLDAWLTPFAWFSSGFLLFSFLTQKKYFRILGVVCALSSLFIKELPLGDGASVIPLKYCVGYFVWLSSWALMAISVAVEKFEGSKKTTQNSASV